MMTLGNLRVMARDARRRHYDDEVADLLDQLADSRAARTRDGLGGGWASAADVPDGVVFCATGRPKGQWWRREGPMCRALQKDGEGRLHSPAVVDAANAFDGAGYVEARS